MALTATALAATRKSVIRLLGLHKPVILSRSPNKNNILCEREKGEEIETELDFLVKELREFRTKTTNYFMLSFVYKDCGLSLSVFQVAAEE